MQETAPETFVRTGGWLGLSAIVKCRVEGYVGIVLSVCFAEFILWLVEIKIKFV